MNPDTGAASADNPAIGDADPNRRRIVAYGFRNPFRFTFRPGTGEIWSGDVGWNTYEEINRTQNLAQVRNYGWPCYEGVPRMGSYDSLNIDSCETLYTQGAGAVTAPVLRLQPRGEGRHGRDVHDGLIVDLRPRASTRAATFPAAYQDALFFSDYSRNCIWVAAQGRRRAAGHEHPPDLRRPGQRSGVAHAGAGRRALLRRPARAARSAASPPTTARRPRASSPTPTSGVAPLTVNFDGTTSSDPDGQALTYAWDLDGDGAYDDSTAATPSFTYTAAGTVHGAPARHRHGRAERHDHADDHRRGAADGDVTSPRADAPPGLSGDTIDFSAHGERPRERAHVVAVPAPLLAHRRDRLPHARDPGLRGRRVRAASSRPTTSTRPTCCSRSRRATRRA